MPFYRASELFTLRPVPPTLGKPAWMNLRAVPRAPWAGEPEALRGPGIYGMFHDDRLVYVGLYAGKAERPFGGSVLERWEKHVTYQTLRSPYVTFARRHLKHLHALAAAEPNGPIETIVAMLALNGDESPLLQRKGGSCTFAKAQLAAAHWDVFGPGNEATMLDHLGFTYLQLPRDLAATVLPEPGQRPSAWVKKHWLAPIERDLIAAFMPPCNDGTEPGDAPTVDPVAFEERLARLLADRPAPAVEDLAGESEADDETDGDEEALRTEPTAAPNEREALLDDLARLCPGALEIYYTDVPDLRIRPRSHARRVLLNVFAHGGGLACRTKASVAACRALGFDANDAPAGVSMSAAFPIDLSRHSAADLFAVAGAALPGD